MSAAPVVRVAGLVKSYGPVEAVRGLGFEVMPGEAFGFLGPNRAGSGWPSRSPEKLSKRVSKRPPCFWRG